MELPEPIDKNALSEHIVLVGYGRVGKRISAILAQHHIPYIIIEESRDLVMQLRHQKIPALFNGISEGFALTQAHTAKARMLVIATADIFNIRSLINTARALNPDIEIVARIRNEGEADLLRQEVKGFFFVGEEELGRNMSQHIVDQFTHHTEASSTPAHIPGPLPTSG